MNKRAVILSTAVAFGFVLVVIRLADIMLLNHGRLTRVAQKQQTVSRDIQVARGGIYDRRGRELAVNIETDSLYCEPRKVTQPERAARAISLHTSAEYSDVKRLLASRKGFAWVRRKLDPEEADPIKQLEIEGIGFKPELKRFYPGGKLLSHVIGSVGVDNQPLEAVELKYDEVLRKPGGKIAVYRDADGMQISDGAESSSKGNSLVLTIDEGLQYIAEAALDEAMLKWRPSHAVAIMMNPYTGEIMALAGRPAYDPNRPGDFSMDERRNKAITDLYEPGSTFKLITATAALEEGLFTPESRFDCSRGSISVGKWVIRDAHKHGVLSFKEVVQKSSNVGTIQMGLKLGAARVEKYARLLGFGEKTGIDLPGEAQGWVNKARSSDATATLSIGYGVNVSALQVLRAYSAIANGGLLVTPHVVSGILTPEGEMIYKFQPEPTRRAVSARTASVLKDILVSVTDDAGTASGASVDGNRVAGKTGTAIMKDSKSKGYAKGKYVGSFVGFVPADDPKMALIVVVHEPKGEYYGGVVAAPVFKEIAEKSLAYMNVPREDSMEKKLLLVRSDVR